MQATLVEYYALTRLGGTLSSLRVCVPSLKNNREAGLGLVNVSSSMSASGPVRVTPASRREILSWAMYDFANSGFTTVVYTAIFNAYFVSVIAADTPKGAGTLLWTVAFAITNTIVLLTAPLLGAIADHGAHKKRILAVTTAGCIGFTAALGFAGPGDIVYAMVFVILAGIMFGSGENFISAFLPEIATKDNMARISGYGWSLGYVGGLLVLLLCLGYILSAEARGEPATSAIPATLWITAGMFAIASLPTFLWLRERAVPQPRAPGEGYVRTGFRRVAHTVRHARHYRDLFRFLIALAVYYCGINTVITLAIVYAQEAMGFERVESIFLIVVVNVTAAVGAFSFGFVQQRLGAVRTLMLTLTIWIAALLVAYAATSRAGFWVAANLVGLALGASQSAGRTLVGFFSPPSRTAEFFGLWGLAGKLAAVVGPLTYGVVTFVSGDNHRLALLVTMVFFVIGLILLMRVDEDRGHRAALERP
jgi:MFS transporter, UMF1 family